MKIKIIMDEDFPAYVDMFNETLRECNRREPGGKVHTINAVRFMRDKEVIIEDDLGYTKAKTIYRIIK